MRMDFQIKKIGCVCVCVCFFHNTNSGKYSSEILCLAFKSL